MNLIRRVLSILVKPRATWRIVGAEPVSTASLYWNYVMILAVVPAFSTFVGLSLVGIGGAGMSIRVPMALGLLIMIAGYALSLISVFVQGLIINALAPVFGGAKSQIAALKLSAYMSTAGFVGGIFGLLPSLLFVRVLAELYGIYLLYIGLPVLMKCPATKAVPYTAVMIIWTFAGNLVFALVPTLLALMA